MSRSASHSDPLIGFVQKAIWLAEKASRDNREFIDVLLFITRPDTHWVKNNMLNLVFTRPEITRITISLDTHRIIETTRMKGYTL